MSWHLPEMPVTPVPMGEYLGISRVALVPTKEIRALIDSAMDVLKRK